MTGLQHPGRALFALLGALALVMTTALAVGTIRPTEAAWADRAMGAAEFGASPDGGRNFARSAAGYGELKPWLSGASAIGSVQREVTPSTTWIARSTTPSSWSTESVGTFLSPVRASAETRTCARRDNRQPDDCRPLPDQPDAGTASSHAVSQVRNVDASALALLVRVPLVRTSSTPITATASCTPGEIGRAGLAGDPVTIGGNLFDSGDRVHIPAPGRQTTFVRDIGLYTYHGVLQHLHVVSDGYAMSQLRLYVEASGDVLGSQPWVLHMVLAHAECGASRSVTTPPARPDVSWPAPLPEQSARMMSMRAAAVSESVATEEEPGRPVEAEPGRPVEAEPGQPPVTDDVQLPAPVVVDPLAGQATEADAIAGPEPTGPASSPTVEPGPRRPVSVTPGRWFTLVNRDGVELGSAKVDDIARTPGCGVELTLSIATSSESGPGRWSSLGPADVAELRSGGATRDARAVSSDCEGSAASTTTRLSPDREYEIVLAVQLDDSAKRAMLRPEGTAGWAFDLPPLTEVAVVATTATTTTSALPSAESEG